MPIYEYVCTSCQFKFEMLRPLGRMDDPASCPSCKNGARRVLSTFASHSKGAGGESSPIGGMGSSCGACSSGSCASCR